MVLGIYGAGGSGRELLVMAQQINKMHHIWSEILFIDDNSTLENIKGVSVKNFQDITQEYSKKQIEIVISVGEPAIRELLSNKVIDKGYTLATMVHPSVFIPKCTKIGKGTVICSNTNISCDVVIGDNVYIQPMANIAHDVCIKSNSVISTFVSLAGACKIGERSYIGMNVPVREKVSIGDDTIIGMGAVVVKDISHNVMAIGNPATVIRENIHKRVFK